MDPSTAGFAQASIYVVIFIWGPVLPVTCPCPLPPAAREKLPSVLSHEALTPNGLCESASRGHCQTVSSQNENGSSFQ